MKNSELKAVHQISKINLALKFYLPTKESKLGWK